MGPIRNPRWTKSGLRVTLSYLSTMQTSLFCKNISCHSHYIDAKLLTLYNDLQTGECYLQNGLLSITICRRETYLQNFLLGIAICRQENVIYKTSSSVQRFVDKRMLLTKLLSHYNYLQTRECYLQNFLLSITICRRDTVIYKAAYSVQLIVDKMLLFTKLLSYSVKLYHDNILLITKLFLQ